MKEANWSIDAAERDEECGTYRDENGLCSHLWGSYPEICKVSCCRACDEKCNCRCVNSKERR
jgi:hypothetical protein